MRINIYTTALLLFTVLTAADKKRILAGRTALYPAILLYIASGISLLYSDLVIVKTTFLLYAVTSAFEIIVEKINSKALRLTVGAYTLSLATSIALLYSKMLPAHIISIALLCACATLLILRLISLKSDGDSIQTGLALVLLIGAAVSNLSASYYSQLFGILILCVHILAKIFIAARQNINAANEQQERLFALENKFSKKVEFQARRISSEMEDRVEEIEERSMRDPLTKVPNRMMIGKKVHELISENKARMFSLALMDLDNFKDINDTLGHVTGDKCLTNMADIMMKNKRRPDIFGRYGGDEFIVIMPGIDSAEALKLMEYHRKYIDQYSNPHITTTIGISVYPRDGETLEALTEFADKSLYKAKAMGKNCVAYAGDSEDAD